jgi:hypothetical protein
MCNPSEGEMVVRLLFLVVGIVATLGVIVGAKML